MSTWSLTYQQSVFKRYPSDEHFSEFLPTRWRQRSTGTIYSTKLRHCHPMYCPGCEWHATYVNCSKLRTLHALIVKLSLYSTFYSNVYPTDSTVMLLLLGRRWCRCQAGLIIITSTSRWMKRPPRRRRWPPWKTKTPTSRRDAQGTTCFLSPWSYMVYDEPFPDRSRPMSC